MAAKMTFREQMAGFPVWQMFIICIIRFSEPLLFTSLFPYVYFMIRDFHIAPHEKDISKYSGYLALSFAFCQFLFAVQWGKLSDRVGRKPVLMLGLMGTLWSLILFGFSKNFYMALFARLLAGVLNGNVAVVRTVIGEIATERRHQLVAFSTLPLLFNLGSIIGPAISSSKYVTKPPPNPYKSRPDDRIVTDSLASFYDSFTRKHPYALSNIIVACFLWFSFTCAVLFLEETHDGFRTRRDYGVELGDWLLLRVFGKAPRPRPWQKKGLETAVSDVNEPLLGAQNSENEPLLNTQAPGYGVTGNQSPVFSNQESFVGSETPRNEADFAEISPKNTRHSENTPVEDSSTNSAESEELQQYMPQLVSSALVRRYSRTSIEVDAERVLLETTNEVAFTPQVISVIASNFIISLHSVAYNEFLPVFLESSFDKDNLSFPFRISGGFGLNPDYIGTLFSSTGIMGMLIILLVFPIIDRKLGTINGFRLSLSIFPVVYFMAPLTIFTLHLYNPVFPRWVTPLALYSITSFKTLALATGMPQVMILNHRAAPKKYRAYVNSWTMSILALARCTGPLVFGYLMSVGDAYNINWLSWWVMALMALGGLVQSFFLRDYEDDEEEKVKKGPSEEETETV